MTLTRSGPASGSLPRFGDVPDAPVCSSTLCAWRFFTQRRHRDLVIALERLTCNSSSSFLIATLRSAG
jgi:hypothetical protein